MERTAGARWLLDTDHGQPVVVVRMDGGPRLVIEQPARLAADFFTRDASSVGPKAYDQQVGRSDPDRITTSDIIAINTTMRARSPHTAWAALTGASEPLPWLSAISPQFSLFEASEDEWAELRPTVEAALSASVGPYRNLSVATKVLHLKRPRLFPVLDSLVVQQVGGYGRRAIDLMSHLRQVGRQNLDVLDVIATRLKRAQIERTALRILDALLWASHPAAGLAAELREWEHCIRRTKDNESQ